MLEIRRIQPDEWVDAKQLIYRVAHDLFNDPRALEESMAYFESRRQLKDMDDIQKEYFDNNGIFLVIIEDQQMIGTGAIHYYAEGVCELKRLWLLKEYQGKGLGYRMIQELFTFARSRGYQRVRLETDPASQSRAYALYKRLGFRDLHPHPNHIEDQVMEMDL